MPHSGLDFTLRDQCSLGFHPSFCTCHSSAPRPHSSLVSVGLALCSRWQARYRSLRLCVYTCHSTLMNPKRLQVLSLRLYHWRKFDSLHTSRRHSSRSFQLLAFATDDLSMRVGQTLAGLLNATLVRSQSVAHTHAYLLQCTQGNA